MSWYPSNGQERTNGLCSKREHEGREFQKNRTFLALIFLPGSLYFRSLFFPLSFFLSISWLASPSISSFAAKRAFISSLLTVGYESRRLSSVSEITAVTARWVNHLWSAGMIYHGA